MVMAGAGGRRNAAHVAPCAGSSFLRGGQPTSSLRRLAATPTLFRGRERLVRDAILRLALELDWRLEAWAVFANHYHFIAHSPERADSLPLFIRRIHAGTATAINRVDCTPGRRIWGNYWETLITNQRSFFARLSYVHQNAVRHGIVPLASAYPWCSASWFESGASRALVDTVYSFPFDRPFVVDVECGA